MAFVIKKKESFFWPVVFKTPAENGKYETETLTIEFKKLKDSKLMSIISGEEKTDDKGFCKEVVIGWKGVEDQEGKEIPFSKEAFSALLDEYGSAKVIASAYLEAMVGIVQKN